MAEIAFRPLEDDDIPLVDEWLRKDRVRRWFEKPEDWLGEIRNRRGEYSFLHHFIAVLGATPVGFCQYYACADVREACFLGVPRAGTYSIDYLIGEEEFLGMRLGEAMVRALVEMVFRIPAAERVVALPDPENHLSCRTLLGAAFHFDPGSGVYVLENRKRRPPFTP
jgi:RimJ/RimL family protein N-acetyltransferase